MYPYGYVRQRVDNIKCNIEKNHNAIKINTHQPNTFISREYNLQIIIFILFKKKTKVGRYTRIYFEGSYYFHYVLLKSKFDNIMINDTYETNNMDFKSA